MVFLINLFSFIIVRKLTTNIKVIYNILIFFLDQNIHYMCINGASFFKKEKENRIFPNLSFELFKKPSLVGSRGAFEPVPGDFRSHFMPTIFGNDTKYGDRYSAIKNLFARFPSVLTAQKMVKK